MIKEYIICSAIHFQLEDRFVHQPRNIKSGIVVCGRRHHNCFLTAKYMDIITKDYPSTQGFMTNTDRFVDRKEGMKIAIEADQIIADHIGTSLYSEDIY